MYSKVTDLLTTKTEIIWVKTMNCITMSINNAIQMAHNIRHFSKIRILTLINVFLHEKGLSLKLAGCGQSEAANPRPY